MRIDGFGAGSLLTFLPSPSPPPEGGGTLLPLLAGAGAGAVGGLRDLRLSSDGRVALGGRDGFRAHSGGGCCGSPEELGVVYLGGWLMYLGEQEVRALLERLAPRLESGALVLCRESTVRHGTKVLQGEYQVVYRSVATYRRIFAEAGFDVVSAEANAAYICPQMSCELVKKWKSLVPEQCWCLPIIGRLAYWGFRIGYPWNTRVIPWLSARIGWEFPSLTNHFFVLRPRRSTERSRSAT